MILAYEAPIALLCSWNPYNNYPFCNNAKLKSIGFAATTTKTGKVFSVTAALLALISFGPQKYFDAQFGKIWPAVIAGQVAAVVVIYSCFKRAQ